MPFNIETGTTSISFVGGGQALTHVGIERRGIRAALGRLTALERLDVQRLTRGPRSRLSEVAIFPFDMAALTAAKNLLKARLVELLNV